MIMENDTIVYDEEEFRVVETDDGPVLEPQSVHEETDRLALEVERTLIEARDYIEDVPEYEPRSQEAQKNVKAMKNI